MGWKYKSKAIPIRTLLLKEVAKATRATATEIARDAKSRARKSSGAMKESVYVSDSGLSVVVSPRSNYPTATAAAISANPAVAPQIEAEVAPSAPDGVARSTIGVAVDYAREIEEGGYTAGGYRAPASFLKPAATAQEAPHEARVAAAIRKVESKRL